MIVDLSMLMTVVVGFVTVNLGSTYFISQRLGAQVDRLEVRMDSGLERLETRLEGRMDRLEGRMDVLHDSVAEMGRRITHLEERFGRD